MDASERQRVMDLALIQMDKQIGKGALLRLGSHNVVPVTAISIGERRATTTN